MATNKFVLGKDSWFFGTLYLERITELTTTTTNDPTKALLFDTIEVAKDFANLHNIHLCDSNSKDPKENTINYFSIFVV